MARVMSDFILVFSPGLCLCVFSDDALVGARAANDRINFACLSEAHQNCDPLSEVGNRFLWCVFVFHLDLSARPTA
jgi:hypothetical protein